MRIFYFCLFSGILGEIGADLSNLRKCSDEKCNAPLSIGRTLIKYQAKDMGMLSFEPNREVKIFSKEAGSNPDLWGVVIDGKRGYMNKAHVQEQRVIVPPKDVKLEIPIEEFFLNSQKYEEMQAQRGLPPMGHQGSGGGPPHMSHHGSGGGPPHMTQQGSGEGMPPPPGNLHQSSGVGTPPPGPPPLPKTHLPQGTFKTHLPTSGGPSKPKNIEVVDGTTLYLDPGMPAINESPSMENITPSEIQPTSTGLAGVKPTAQVNGIEPSLPEMPEIESSVRSPVFQDLEESSPKNTDTVLTGNTVGGPVPTEPQTAGQPAPLEVTEPIQGEVVKEMPRTATPVEPADNNQPSMAAQVNLPKEGLEASATVGMTKEDGGHNPEPIVASAVTEPPFDDSIDDHEDEKETEDEVADYDSYDDYDDEFSATLKDLDNILDSKESTKESAPTEETKTTDNNINTDIKSEAVNKDNNAEAILKEETIENSNINSEDNFKIDENLLNIGDKVSENVANTETIEEALKENIMNQAHKTIDIPDIPVNKVHNSIESSAVKEEVESPIDNVKLPEVTLPDVPNSTETPVFVDTNGDLSLEQPEQIANEEPATENIIEQETTENTIEEQTLTENAPKEEDPGFFSGWFGSGAGLDTENIEQEKEQNPSDFPESVNDQPEENTAAESVTEPENLPYDTNENPGIVSNEANNNPVDTFADIPELNPRAVDNDAESLGQTPEMTNDFNVVDMPQDSVTLNQLAPEEGLGLQQDGQFDPSKYPVPENPYKEGEQPIIPDTEVPTEATNNDHGLDIDYLNNIVTEAPDLDDQTYTQQPDPYSQPSDVYSQSADSYTQSSDQYSQPADTYTQQPDSYNQQAESYQPLDSYNQPADSYYQPADPNNQPADTYNQPADTYNQPADTYNQPADPYNQPADPYNQPADPYNQPADPYNQQQDNNGMEDHKDSPVTGYFMQYMPEWLHVAAHEAGGVNGDRAILLVVIAFTLILIYLINICMTSGSREKPLLAKVAELDRKLFQSTSEIQLLRKEASERGSLSEDTVSSAQVRELEIQFEQANIEKDRLENHSREIQARCTQFQDEIYRAVAIQQEKEKETEIAVQEKEAALEETRQAQEMVEEMISSQNNNQPDTKLIELVQKLQKQLENQQDVLKQYEPKLKKKEKEAKELSKECKQLRADKANAELARDKAEKQMNEINTTMDDKVKLIEEKEKNEEEWRSLSDLLQKQLDEKSEHQVELESEASTLKSRLNIYQNELEEKEEQMEVLQETINELKKIKGQRSSKDRDTDSAIDNGEKDGWEVDGEDGENGWEVEEDIVVADDDQEVDESTAISDIGEVAKLKVSARRASKAAKRLQEEVKTVESSLSEAKNKLDEREKECNQLRTARDETVSELVETTRKLEVLEQFFNKKEAELQKQLGLQSARFGDVSSSADTIAKQLQSVTEELESKQGAIKLLKSELEEQEKSLKAAVAVQEKKAHENWVAARQAERKLTDLQTEISTLRNRLTVTESRALNLEQEKTDLQQTIQAIQQDKPEGLKNGSAANSTTGPLGDHSSETNSITDPASLPPLPGLPVGLGGPSSVLPPLPGLGGLPSMPPMMMPTVLPPIFDTRPPTLGRISPSRERERSDLSFRSRGEYSPTHRGRDYSPSTRSERRGGGGRRGSPIRRPSPTRSDRGYYRDRDSSTDRSYRHDDRYDRRGPRDDDYDRYYDRRGNREDEHYERRGSRDYRDGGDRDEEYYERRGGGGGPVNRSEYLDLKTGPKTSSPLEPNRGKFMA